MTKKEIYYDSRDNQTKIHAVVWTPDTEPKAIVILVHGMAEHIERYDEFAQFLCEKGYVVAGNDHLGHGKSVGRNPKGYFCRRDPATVVVRDVHRLKKTIQNDYPTLPVVIFGHSMGSMIVRNYLTKYGTGVDAAVICGTLFMPKFLLHVMGAVLFVTRLCVGSKHPSKFLDKLAFGGYNRRIDNPVSSFDWVTSDKDKLNSYLNDPDCGFLFTVNGFHTLRVLSLRLHDKKLLNCIPKDLPVFFIYGGQDPCGEYGVAVRKVIEQYKELGIKTVESKEYPDKRHALIEETNRAEVMEDVLDFIQSVLKTNK